jgi:hypothetical protein
LYFAGIFNISNVKKHRPCAGISIQRLAFSLSVREVQPGAAPQPCFTIRPPLRHAAFAASAWSAHKSCVGSPAILSAVALAEAEALATASGAISPADAKAVAGRPKAPQKHRISAGSQNLP